MLPRSVSMTFRYGYNLFCEVPCMYVTECSPSSTERTKDTKICLLTIQSTRHYKRNTNMGVICHTYNMLLLKNQTPRRECATW
jgi:hypothetical protein